LLEALGALRACLGFWSPSNNGHGHHDAQRALGRPLSDSFETRDVDFIDPSVERPLP
jgi:hypothetical protein